MAANMSPLHPVLSSETSCHPMQATGLRGRFSAKASVRDMARKLWVLVRQEALAQGVPPSAICAAPQTHRCSGASAAGDRFLLGLPHIQALYLLSNQDER